tara:strand:+ start:480 stop:1268 length:789 start_codon:yes stop_codon:yes gene_type:complete
MYAIIIEYTFWDVVLWLIILFLVWKLVNWSWGYMFGRYVQRRRRLRVDFGKTIIILLILCVIYVGNVVEPIKEEIESYVDSINISEFTEEIDDSWSSDNLDEKPYIDIIELEDRIHDLINIERENQGLSPLTKNLKIVEIARGHSQDMARRNYFSHDTPEGKDPTDRGNEKGYNCNKDYGDYITYGLAENIFQNNLYGSVEYYGSSATYDWNSMEEIAVSTVEGWMDSQGHRENILTASYDETGVGLAISSDDKVYVTQNFC